MKLKLLTKLLFDIKYRYTTWNGNVLIRTPDGKIGYIHSVTEQAGDIVIVVTYDYREVSRETEKR